MWHPNHQNFVDHHFAKYHSVGFLSLLFVKKIVFLLVNQQKIAQLKLKKFLNPFCFACTLGLLP